ncbi:glycosyltransferase [Nocardia puris]|uniref:glycosyltransferase family 2 protein n=1 Tax=Nocardia puris TaxID=208602 RepID=UPI0018947D7B|nr:glycosyltransferase [Nocardia puris]MBF6209731.1 glycosyltransferase [Nocardia puris]MBF6366303.1 glycosyltransferase [Nocardia puris]MBF6458358.1 glycosyltransferase [Nocardia puris]
MNSRLGRRRTLRSAILAHDNDYGFDPRTPHWPAPPLRVSCVVPYYETGPLAIECVHRLAAAVAAYRAGIGLGAPAAQIVVVDDGSRTHPFPADAAPGLVRVIRLPHNQGRAAARNTGLRASREFDLALFVDSDVLVHPDLVIETCRLWQPPTTRPGPIVASLMSTYRAGAEKFAPARAISAASITADWRFSCRFQPSWIADPSDWMYVGHRFNLVPATNYFRSWHGAVGPWLLPNMVLGGCFAVPVGPALAVGGFDEAFARYGFTETSLAARLTASGVPVIPQITVAAVHVEHNPAHHNQRDRDTHLATAHRRFFTEFLAHDLD